MADRFIDMEEEPGIVRDLTVEGGIFSVCNNKCLLKDPFSKMKLIYFCKFSYFSSPVLVIFHTDNNETLLYDSYRIF